MTRREPVQKRSRQRVEEILLASADLLAKSGKPEDLTTTSVSKRSGVPVATIYRYFADRSAIIAALIDKELDEMDRLIAAKLIEQDEISIDLLLELILRVHFEYFNRSRRAVILWFGARQSRAVLEKIDRRYSEWGDWLFNGCKDAGLVVADSPEWGGEAIFWLSDRMFEFMFRTKRSTAEREAIFDLHLEMVANQLHKFCTPAGIEGIPTEEFIEQAGDFLVFEAAPGGEVDQTVKTAI